MKKISLLAPLAALVLSSGLLGAADIKGSGASFPFSVYQEWISAYNKATGVQVDYVKKGSSAGIKDITDRSVDFAGSDEPLTKSDLASKKLYQFPGVVGAITMSYNIPGVKKLNLSQAAVAAIALGKASYWDDAVIASANKGLKLPHQKITFVHRADGSGTTFNFTYFLSLVSAEWRTKFGADKTINWPGDSHVGGKTNSGVAALIKQTPYSVGYVDYADAKSNSLAMASVQNAVGEYVAPTLKSFQTAAAKASLSPSKDFYAIIANPKGAGAYPMVAATFILVPKEAGATNKKVTAFYDWAYTHGGTIASNLGYVPLPAALTSKVRAYWASKGIK